MMNIIVEMAVSNDAFLHISALEKAGISQLEVGQAITYELAEQRGKQSATEIKTI